MAKSSEYDLIEKYLDGTLSTPERKLFDERLKTDPILFEKFSDRIKLQKSWVKIAQYNHVKQHISRLIHLEKQNQKSRTNNWLVAASLIVLIGISSVIFVRYNQNGSDRDFLANGKSSNSNKGELIVEGQKNEIKKYGSADSIRKVIDIQPFLPKEGTVFTATDTITFSWPATPLKEKLVVFDENWIKVVDVKLQKGITEYKLAPQRLKPGAYTWILTPNSSKYQFTIR
jgi:hypothetical protein